MLSQLRDSYIKFRGTYVVQKRRQHEYAINRYYAHLIDPFFTKLVYDLKLTPNMVTIFTGLLGIGAALSFLYEHWITGAILLQLHHFFDGADGNLARLTDRCTPFGAKLDQYSDQIVRLVLFVCLAISADVALWAKLLLPVTILFDVWIVHNVILPYSRKHSLVRANWKKKILDKGIIPGFDIFTIFFIISIASLFHRIEYAVYLIIIFKNLDWIYRAWECIKTNKLLKKNNMEHKKV